ncbi:secreted RxLR effector protein 161-like [Vigna umbellata]|uniref:secreted RxLR effector protein 161-like n=1 Tax=Vigna umbellata TaxID=87088 RepID=UPI001F5E8808|nr:secreted RxLR effector protein 161-like [Vigna umbellata]
MESIPYVLVVGSLMYAQTCTRPDINFDVRMLDRYQSNPGMDHWKAAKKVLRYLQGTKEYMLTYRKSDHLEVIDYSDSDYAECVDSRKSTFGYVYLLARGTILGKVQNNQSLLLPPWRLNSWHGLRPRFMLCGCGTLYQGLALLTVLLDQ